MRPAFQEYGPPHAPPLVFLHALMSSSATWRGMVPRFADRFRVLTPDLRGHGQSEWPGAYSLELMRDDVIELMDALGLEAVTLIGHSLGAAVASRVAQQAPGRLRRLVLEELPPPPVKGEELELVAPKEKLRYDWQAVVAVLKQVNQPDPRWWDRLAAIAVPTLVLSGGPDSYVDQERMAMAAQRIPSCRHLTISVGHQIHKDAPEEFAAAVSAFLDER